MTHKSNRPQGLTSNTTEQLFGYLDEIVRMISRQYRLSKLILSMELAEMSALSDLQAAVARNGDVEASAVALIQGIAQQLKDAQGDPAALSALQAQLTSQADALAAAVTANTPASGGSTGGVGGSTGGV